MNYGHSCSPIINVILGQVPVDPESSRTFVVIARIFQITRNPVPFEVKLLSRIFNPLQGFFFIVVYSRPHVKAIQKSNPELYWFQAFVIAFKAGGDNDFGNNQMEIVDEEGVDVPRLPDSERERRQEIVWQQ